MSASNLIMYAGWHTPQSWAKLKELSVDRDEMAKTYEEFVENFKRQVRDFEAAGVTVTTVQIDVDHMAKWCKKNGIPLDGNGRATYGAALGAVDGDKARMDEIPLNDPHGLLERVH